MVGTSIFLKLKKVFLNVLTNYSVWYLFIAALSFKLAPAQKILGEEDLRITILED